MSEFVDERNAKVARQEWLDREGPSLIAAANAEVEALGMSALRYLERAGTQPRCAVVAVARFGRTPQVVDWVWSLGRLELCLTRVGRLCVPVRVRDGRRLRLNSWRTGLVVGDKEHRFVFSAVDRPVMDAVYAVRPLVVDRAFNSTDLGALGLAPGVDFLAGEDGRARRIVTSSNPGWADSEWGSRDSLLTNDLAEATKNLIKGLDWL